MTTHKAEIQFANLVNEICENNIGDYFVAGECIIYTLSWRDIDNHYSKPCEPSCRRFSDGQCVHKSQKLRNIQFLFVKYLYELILERMMTLYEQLADGKSIDIFSLPVKQVTDVSEEIIDGLSYDYARADYPHLSVEITEAISRFTFNKVYKDVLNCNLVRCISNMIQFFACELPVTAMWINLCAVKNGTQVVHKRYCGAIRQFDKALYDITLTMQTINRD